MSVHPIDPESAQKVPLRFRRNPVRVAFRKNRRKLTRAPLSVHPTSPSTAESLRRSSPAAFDPDWTSPSAARRRRHRSLISSYRSPTPYLPLGWAACSLACNAPRLGRSLAMASPLPMDPRNRARSRAAAITNWKICSHRQRCTRCGRGSRPRCSRGPLRSDGFLHPANQEKHPGGILGEIL